MIKGRGRVFHCGRKREENWGWKGEGVQWLEEVCLHSVRRGDYKKYLVMFLFSFKYLAFSS